ncbi:MAG: hypothetical protein VX589_13760 [Myxococcota bacterium]|nr:hypothetical protein [Myxococcota bacterium]
MNVDLTRLRRIASILLMGTTMWMGCSQPRPPSLQTYAKHIAAQTPDDETGWARRGWWLYLIDDQVGAAASFSRAGQSPLGQLGRLQIARDQLALSDGLEGPAGCTSATLAGGIMRRLLPDGSSAQRSCYQTDPRITAHAVHSPTQMPYTALHQLAQSKQPPQFSELPFQVVNLDSGRFPTWSKLPGLRLIKLTTRRPASALEITVRGPALVWDSQMVLHTSLDEDIARTWTFRVQPHHAIHMATRTQDEVVVRLVKAPEKIRPTHRGPDDAGQKSSAPDWVQIYLETKDALTRGDHHRAWRMLADAPRTGPFENLRGAVWQIMPDVNPQERLDAQISAWSKGQRIAPIRAGVQLARTLRIMGRLPEAEGIIEPLVQRAPRTLSVLIEWVQVLWAADRRIDAARVLPELLALNALPCTLYSIRRDLMLDRPTHLDDLVALMSQCGQPVEASRRLRKAHRPQDALNLLNRLGINSPASRFERAQSLIALGHMEAARRVASVGGSFELERLSLDLASTLSNSALDHGAIRHLVAQYFSHPDAVALMAAQSRWSPLMTLFEKTEAAIKAYEKTMRTAGTTRVLDHSILLYGRQGRALRRVHEVLAINSREAAEEFGELGLPPDARPVAIYTRKSDGRIRHADWSSEKSSVSMPGLVSGDYVVAIYLQPVMNHGLLPNGFLSERAYFRDLDREIFLGRFDVVYPSGTRPMVERLHGAPEPSWSTTPFGGVGTFRRQNVPAVIDEPQAPRPDLFLPSMRIGHGIDLEKSRLAVQEHLLKQRISNARFDDWVRTQVGRLRGDAGIRRILDSIRETYVYDDDLTTYGVSRGLSDGRGHRALALSRALELMGIPHRLLLAQTPGANLGRTFHQIDQYPIPLIELADGRLIMAGLHRGPMDYMPVALLGGQGLPIWPSSQSPPIRPLPRQRRIEDLREVTMRAHWRADGVLKGRVIERLTGHEAIALGDRLSGLEKHDRLKVIEGYLQRSIPSAQITTLSPIDLGRTAESMEIDYQFEAELGEQLDLGTFPRSPGRTHASLPSRTTPLVLNVPVNQSVRIEILSDRPIAGPSTRFERRWGTHRHWMHVVVDATKLTVDARLNIKAGQIAALVYPSFSAWAQRVDVDERIQLFRPSSSGPSSDLSPPQSSAAVRAKTTMQGVP